MNGWLNDDAFEQGLASLPLVSIDLLIKDTASERYLFGWRRNRPAAERWFVPGGRILKNERLEVAFSRLCEVELGMQRVVSDAQFRGVFEHFYSDSIFGNDLTTHYVVLAYKLDVTIDELELPLAQHSQFAWKSEDELLQDRNVHQYSQDYFLVP
jgi:colanic acid biosynthesis protein WcaH